MIHQEKTVLILKAIENDKIWKSEEEALGLEGQEHGIVPGRVDPVEVLQSQSLLPLLLHFAEVFGGFQDKRRKVLDFNSMLFNFEGGNH